MIRGVVTLTLYAAAGLLAFLALGAGVSEPGGSVTKATLIFQGQALLGAAALAAWTAGLLWIGGATDAIWKLFANQRAPAYIFVVLAIVFAIPLILLKVVGEVRVLSDLQMVTWLLTPPSAIFALLRFAR